jgi:hypothetical protein
MSLTKKNLIPPPITAHNFGTWRTLIFLWSSHYWGCFLMRYRTITHKTKHKDTQHKIWQSKRPILRSFKFFIISHSSTPKFASTIKLMFIEAHHTMDISLLPKTEICCTPNHLFLNWPSKKNHNATYLPTHWPNLQNKKMLPSQIVFPLIIVFIPISLVDVH